jgi:hypothetical protein
LTDECLDRLASTVKNRRILQHLILKMSFRCIAMLEFVRTNQNPKENGGAKRRHSLWGFMY